MKILLVSIGYPPHIGGAQTQARFVAQQLSRRHHVEVAAVAFSVHSSVPPWLFAARDRVVAVLRAIARRTGTYDGALARRFRRMREFCADFDMYLWFKPYPDHADGPVKVHSLAPSHLARLPLIVAAWIASRDAEPGQRREVFLRAFFDRLYLPRLRAAMQGQEVVHSLADGYLGWAAEQAARERGLPFVITPYVHPGHHGEDDQNVEFYRRADAVFALLETGQATLAKLGVPRERLRLSGVVPLLPSSVDPVGFRQREGLGTRPMVLFVGRIMDYKGVHAMLAATAQVWAAVPDAHFCFVGPSERGSHEAITRLDDSRVRYLGVLSEQDKGDALSACDVFCMPSIAEILPAVYLEAWTYGRPVVGGLAHGLRELIEGNDAGVVVSHDPAEVARALVALLTDPVRRRELGENGRALVRRRFTADALTAALESAYVELAGRAERS
ncbi:MAG: glycosyltransferase family 4 protein [Vicinamibacterales bacterium]